MDRLLKMNALVDQRYFKTEFLLWSFVNIEFKYKVV